MPQVWVSIGSNVDRRRHILGALDDLRRDLGALTVSRVYESEAVGFEGPAFYNLVAGFRSDLGPVEIGRRLRAIEAAHGRRRTDNRFAPRTLDLDLLTYGNQAGRFAGLELPRDEILKYAFVLGPLAEVAPGERHPVDGRTYAELWKVFDRAGQAIHPVELAV
jgi:2-amino-4-hydroxy-6-hydroxymethyldihydropteridine diphosphokinase